MWSMPKPTELHHWLIFHFKGILSECPLFSALWVKVPINLRLSWGLVEDWKRIRHWIFYQKKKSSLPMERPGGTVVLLRAPRGWMLSHDQRTGTKLTFVQGSKAYEWSFQLDGTYGDRPPERKSHQMNEQILTLVQPLLLKVFLLFDRRTKTNKNFLTRKRTARNWQKTLMRFYSH